MSKYRISFKHLKTVSGSKYERYIRVTGSPDLVTCIKVELVRGIVMQSATSFIVSSTRNDIGVTAFTRL